MSSRRTEIVTPTPTPAPDPVTPVVPEPTATLRLTQNEAAADAIAVQEALGYLQPFLAKAKEQLPGYRAVWQDAAPVVKAARAENLNLLTAHGLGDHTRGRFEMVLRAIEGLGTDIQRYEDQLNEAAKLTGPKCRRTAWHHAANEWPSAVKNIRDACLMLNEPAEEKGKKLQALRAEHANLISLVPGLLKTSQPLTATESRHDEPLRSELAFDPRKTP